VPRIAIATGIALALLVGLVALGGFLLIRRYESAFNRDTLLAPDARAQGHAALTGPLTFLLVGSDYRTWSPNAGQRSDTIIVAHVDRNLDHVYLVSVPRDLLVAIPPDPATNYPGGMAKINAAFEAGHGGAPGIQLLSQTLNDLGGLRFDGAAAVNFDGLKHAVDLLDGVNMCVDVATKSIHTGKVFPVGCRLMNSTDVLDYLRQREQYQDGDFSRQRHQQQFLKAVLQRASSAGLLTNPVKLDEFIRAVGSAMTVDTGSYSMTDVVFGLRGLNAKQLSGVKVPSYNSTVNGQAVVIGTPDASTLFAAIRDDTLDTWTRQHPQWVNGI
jgi:LCP family protein required for cell wall assembly